MRKKINQLALAIPPIARLYNQRNELQFQRDELLRLVKTLEEKIAQGPATNNERILQEMRNPQVHLDNSTLIKAELEREKSDFKIRVEQGFLIETDYPYLPKVRSWETLQGGNPWRSLISANEHIYAKLLNSFVVFEKSFHSISNMEPIDSTEPFWANDWLPPLDGISIYGLLSSRNPRLYVEVGSGNSTKYARRAIRDQNLRTRIISIDPMPRAEIDEICDQVIRSGLQETNLSIFEDLGDEDVVFIDNSHRSFQNSDVTVFFTEILPSLKSGCHYGIHDIFLPSDYPQEWLKRYYNEQYLLMAYLLGGAGGDEIVMPIAYIAQSPVMLNILSPILEHQSLSGTRAIGGAFWMKKA
ncbi:class I SAM-dependent methyltransferase (plasmid) [Phyllobacterium sp. A18/5-2]|uniref:class I SAM-dependent methyltransferase n=1 Tax=Phyllobacterium sp. A18/5-2 TaxID=2978392 RepID=UPI0021CA477C|nr:class I SAM-dependent methyltransferase [Phyllobacterium sp. A18/5-2]UXN66768.1 class I SAM-dependent methyltransferase [Phyllobacterium sp. A18/5-2]